MEKKSLIIINNEKVFEEDGQFYCDNFDMKATPEALNNYYFVQFIVRKSKKKGGHKFDLKNIKIGSNIFYFKKQDKSKTPENFDILKFKNIKYSQDKFLQNLFF